MTTVADEVHVLAEYERRTLPLSATAARDLVRVANGRVTVTPAPDGGFVVQARQFVGTIALPGLRLLVRPKVPVANLFVLLGAALPSDAWRPEQFAYATADDLLAVFAEFYARTCELTLRAGLLRKYRVLSERLWAIRGRIDLPTQLRHPGLVSPVACTFDEFTDDVVENRIVRAAIARLLRVPGIDTGVRRRLRHELARFADVGDDVPDLAVAERLPFDRLNRHYEPLMALSLLVLRGVSFRDAAGGTTASAFLVDMNLVFQRFVTTRLRRALAGVLDVEAEPLVYLGRDRTVPMRPDLVLRRGRRRVYVGDVKYAVPYTITGFAPHYYQLHAYATALAMPEGVLVYATTEAETPPGEVEVRHAGTRLFSWKLPLGGTPRTLDERVANLAAWLVERTSAAEVRDPAFELLVGRLGGGRAAAGTP